jgi:ATP citrate (pro-S)-lyase
MRNLSDIRERPGTILAVGSYRSGYQSIIDFDKLCGKSEPSIIGIVGSSKRFEKYFWGNDEVLIPCFKTIQDAKSSLRSVDWLLNITSGRRAHQTTVDFFDAFPDSLGVHIFAEDVPEKAALNLIKRYKDNGKTIIGPAGVGLLVPGSLKLGVVGGVDWRQLQKNSLHTPGSVAVVSASGGMINEIITIVSSTAHNLSFALCVGGDRFPYTDPIDAFLAAENDVQTSHIVYYGELGGEDEYRIVECIDKGEITKPVIAYVAGVIGEIFDQPVQFGHAKALASSIDETASAKRTIMKEAGVHVADSMKDFKQLIADIPQDTNDSAVSDDFSNRTPSTFTSTISKESASGYEFAGTSLQDWAKEGDIAMQIATALLGRRPLSDKTTELVRQIFLLSIDHGPQVSGALNTIITARAGKGVVDSLAAGLLTVGPRFGGAVSDAANEWFHGVNEEKNPAEHVESYAKAKKYIAGIGHKKYRLDLPDPRTTVLSEFVQKLDSHPYFDYAKSIEAITTTKKGTLILNVDGHIAAIMLDILSNEEKMTPQQLQQLIDADFFNALFVIPRSVGFVAHYLDQKRLDEGLFRLPDSDVFLG